MSCSCTSAIEQITRDIRLLQQSVGSTITSQQLSQTMAILNTQLNNLQSQINLINCSGNFQSLIEQASTGWITTTQFNQFNAVVSNQYNLLQTDICNLQTTVNLLAGEIDSFIVGKTYISSEVPAGAINNVNTHFVLNNIPNPPTSLHLYFNGLRVATSGDYTLFNNSITSTYILPSGTTMLADYIY